MAEEHGLCRGDLQGFSTDRGERRCGVPWHRCRGAASEHAESPAPGLVGDERSDPGSGSPLAVPPPMRSPFPKVSARTPHFENEHLPGLVAPRAGSRARARSRVRAADRALSCVDGVIAAAIEGSRGADIGSPDPRGVQTGGFFPVPPVAGATGGAFFFELVVRLNSLRVATGRRRGIVGSSACAPSKARMI